MDGIGVGEKSVSADPPAEGLVGSSSLESFLRLARSRAELLRRCAPGTSESELSPIRGSSGTVLLAAAPRPLFLSLEPFPSCVLGMALRRASRPSRGKVSFSANSRSGIPTSFDL